MKYTLTFENREDLNNFLRKQSQKCKIHADDVENNIEHIHNLQPNKCTLVGFRECGVDGVLYIQLKSECPSCYGTLEDIYREIDKVTVVKKNNKEYYVVKRLFKNHYNVVERGLERNMYKS